MNTGNGTTKQRTKLSKQAKKGIAIAARKIVNTKERLLFLQKEAPEDFDVQDPLSKAGNWFREKVIVAKGRPCSYGDVIDCYLANEVRNKLENGGNVRQFDIDILRDMLERLCQTFYHAFVLDLCDYQYNKAWAEKFALRYDFPSKIAKIDGTNFSKAR
jgi:hypothetical protein